MLHIVHNTQRYKTLYSAHVVYNAVMRDSVAFLFFSFFLLFLLGFAFVKQERDGEHDCYLKHKNANKGQNNGVTSGICNGKNVSFDE